MTASFKAVRRASDWARALWLAGIVGSLVVGLLTLVFFAAPYRQARAWGDGLSADGSFERLTPEVFAALRAPGRLTGGLALLGGAALIVFRRGAVRGIERLLIWTGGQARRLPGDAAALGRAVVRADSRAARLEWAGLGLLTLGAIAARALFLTRPMAHDEAYTFVGFASRPWVGVITDYHLPNNHIFHSILVKLSTGLLGIEPWAVRLPAFVAGVLTIPAAYLLARRLYGRGAAWVSAGLAAVLPVMILYSSNARGYSLFTLFSLLIAGLAVYLKDHNNLAGWLLLALLGALGLYTVPVMLYPFGMVITWLLLTAIAESGLTYGGRRRMIACTGAAALLAVGLAGLLYLPVVVWGTGLKSLVGNPFVIPLPWGELPETLWSRMVDTWQEWNLDLPGWAGPLLAVGFGLSLALHRWISRVRVPLQLAAALCFTVLLLIQRPNAYARMWTFLIPFALIWSAAGLIEPFYRVRWGARLKHVLVGLALVGMAAGSWVYTHVENPALQPYMGEMEQVVTRYLKPRVQDGDIVIISSEDSPVLWYYLKLYGIPERTVHHLEEHPFPFRRAYVVVSLREGQTLASAVAKRGLRPEDFALDTAARLGQVGETVIYETMAR